MGLSRKQKTTNGRFVLVIVSKVSKPPFDTFDTVRTRQYQYQNTLGFDTDTGRGSEVFGVRPSRPQKLQLQTGSHERSCASTDCDISAPETGALRTLRAVLSLTHSPTFFSMVPLGLIVFSRAPRHSTLLVVVCPNYYSPTSTTANKP